MNNWDYGGSIPTAPWRSAMSVPRELHLTTVDGADRLTAAPVSSLKSLRGAKPFMATKSHALLPGTTTLSGRNSSGDTLDIVATFKVRDAQKFGLKVRVGNGQRTTIGYDAKRGGVYVDRTKSGKVDFNAQFPSVEFAPLKPVNGSVTLRVLVDRSSVEVFGNDGRVTITDQVFPDPGSKAVQVFSQGGRAQLQTITIWRLKSAWRSDLRGSGDRAVGHARSRPPSSPFTSPARPRPPGTCRWARRRRRRPARDHRGADLDRPAGPWSTSPSSVAV